MAKPTVNAKEVLEDIRAGMDNAALGEKYKLSEAGLESLFKKLVKAGLLKQSDMDKRFPGQAPGAIAWKCPACGATSPQVWDSCPRCGVDVAKYRKQGADLGGSGVQGTDTRADEGPKKISCPFCNKEIDSTANKCVHCGNLIGASPTDDDIEDEWEEAYCPWEDVRAIGWFEAIKQTVMGVLFTPTEFFSKIPRKAGYQAPLLYGVIMGSFGIILGQFWGLLMEIGTGTVTASTFLLIIFSPVLAGIGIAIGALLNHLCLYLIGGASEDLEATFRAVCYSSSTNVWAVVPFVGSMVGGIWQIVAVIIGLREVHQTTTGKAVLAVFLPVIVCCTLGVVVAFTAGFMGAAFR